MNNAVIANSASSRTQTWGVDGGVATRIDDRVTLYLYYSTTANAINLPYNFKSILSVQISAMRYDDNITAAYIESITGNTIKVSAWARWGGSSHDVNTAFYMTVTGFA